MQLQIELTEQELKNLIRDYLEKKLGDVTVDMSKLDIQVKSKQNYKSEWESAAFKAVYKHCELPSYE